jgi:hypothetical protein
MAVTPGSLILPQAIKRTVLKPTIVAQTTVATPPVDSKTTLILTAGANGSRLNKMVARPLQTVSAMAIWIFRRQTSGSNLVLYNSVLMPAYTLATTGQIPGTDFGYDDAHPAFLYGGETWYASVGVGSQAWSLEIEWQDY